MAKKFFTKIKGSVAAPKGFLAGGLYCGIKRKPKPDLTLIVSEVAAHAAGVFTQNKVHAAPVKISRQRVRNGVAQAIVASSGCANACTGKKGLHDAEKVTEFAAKALGLSKQDVLICSTGPIGTFLPMDKLETGIAKLSQKISRSGGDAAAKGIMTTDLVPKSVAIEVVIDGKKVRIGAIAKGSGMIRPNMATMFCLVTTDAHVEKKYLQKALKNSVDKTFNRIDVDGDTSTNDTVLCLANGLAGNKLLKGGDRASQLFEDALDFVNMEMAKAIVVDGEGATKLVQIEVRGAKSKEDAFKVCEAVTNSKLIKTSFYGENTAAWGRILAAVGYSGAKVDENLIDVYFGKKHVVKQGIGNGASKEEQLHFLRNHHLPIRIELNLGKYHETMWTCDLSHKYIDINI